MTNITASTIALETAIERLRQERVTFDQRKAQEEKWFTLRLRMGNVAVFMLPAIAAISGHMILNPEDYSPQALNTAVGALLADLLGLFGAVWKVVLNPESMTKLSPVTSEKYLNSLSEDDGQ